MYVATLFFSSYFSDFLYFKYFKALFFFEMQSREANFFSLNAICVYNSANEKNNNVINTI